MKIWDGLVLFGAIALAAISFIVVAAVIYLKHDLRGWPPTSNRFAPTTVIEATLDGNRSFTFAECLPGSIDPYDFPTTEEYSGDATVTVLSCRSRSSAITIGLVYLLCLALVTFIVVRIAPWKRRTAPAS